MEIHQARYFLAVCSELNFTRAARRCNISQPSLTRAIQKLEEEFGGYLFRRQRSSIELTDLGKLIRPYLEEVWQKASTAKRIAKDHRELAPRELKLAIMCTIAPRLLIRMLGRFRERHPEIQIQLVDGKAQLLQEQLLNFQTEVAIYCLPDREPDARLNYLPLFLEQMMIVLPEEHRLSKQHSIEICDLAGERYVQRAFCEFAEIVNFRDTAGEVSDARDEGREVTYMSDRDDWVLAMVASGFGYGFLPKHSISHDRVISRPLVNPEYWRNIQLVTVRDRLQSHAVGALVHEMMRTEWVNQEALAVTAPLTAN